MPGLLVPACLVCCIGLSAQLFAFLPLGARERARFGPAAAGVAAAVVVGCGVVAALRS